MLKLHYSPRTISVAVAITLEQAGISYKAVRVDFANAEQTGAAYAKVNPKGRVPALETPEGMLTETGAILEYIAPDLVPSDPFAAAKMRELMYYLASTMHVNHAHKIRGGRWANNQSSFDDMATKVPETVAASCAYVEQLLPDVPRPGFLVSDAYLYVILTWLAGDGVDIRHYPKLDAFKQRMDATTAVQAVYKKGMFG